MTELSITKSSITNTSITYQECLYKDKIVWVVSLLSRSGKIHRWVKPYIGIGGVVVGEAKNGMLLVKFSHGEAVAIPAGCLALYDQHKHAKDSDGRIMFGKIRTRKVRKLK